MEDPGTAVRIPLLHHQVLMGADGFHILICKGCGDKSGQGVYVISHLQYTTKFKMREANTSTSSVRSWRAWLSAGTILP